MTKTALITGASSGIGKATAIKLAKLKYKIIITGRREDLLVELSEQIKKEYKVDVHVLTFDIRNRETVFSKIKEIPEDFQNIDVLVNNAGLASGLSLIQDGDIEDWEKMIDTNIKGLLYVSRAIMPLMTKRKSGHIINIGSIAGKETYMRGNVYCGTKHAVDSITKSMRIDMLSYGIKVSSINPGMVDTEFSTVRFHGNKEKADAVYNGLTPLYAEDIAETIEFVVTRPSHVNINDILIMPTSQANSVYTHKTS